jgi:rod shape-determining protein MreC
MSRRGFAGILMFFAVLLMLFSVIAPKAAEKARITALDQVSIALVALSTPTQKIAQMFEHMTGLSDMAADLNRLRQENAKLKQWYDRARQLEAENTSLRGLVKLNALPRQSFATARVIAESGTAFSQAVLIDAGERDGIVADSVAMTGEGLVGRVMATASGTSNITLLTDAGSRIPVVIENSRHRGMLVGDNTKNPRFMYLPDDAAVSVGERVLTSGYGGVFGAGLPVGVIVSNKAGDIRVKPFADMRRLDFVQVINFGRSSLLNDVEKGFKP